MPSPQIVMGNIGNSLPRQQLKPKQSVASLLDLTVGGVGGGCVEAELTCKAYAHSNISNPPVFDMYHVYGQPIDVNYVTNNQFSVSGNAVADIDPGQKVIIVDPSNSGEFITVTDINTDHSLLSASGFQRSYKGGEKIYLVEQQSSWSINANPLSSGIPYIKWIAMAGTRWGIVATNPDPSNSVDVVGTSDLITGYA